MSQIELSNIKKSFGETQALVDASLTTELGEIHAIVGENGSGKSTLAKIMSGVIPADGGSISVLGGQPKNPAEAIKLGISTIYQEIMVAEELAIWENMFAGVDGLWRKTMSSAEKRRRSQEILERLAKTPINPDAIVGRQPLNIKQWIVIARAIIQEPKVLIFDESSAALDLEATHRLHAEMKRMKDGGACIILVTHRIAELVKIADSATVLRDGVTVGRLSKEEITEENILLLMSASAKEDVKAATKKKVLTTAQQPVLETTELTLLLGRAPIKFNINVGEIIGIAGLDGAGQASFVRMLAGIQVPVIGAVRAFGNFADGITLTALGDAEEAGIAYVSGDRKRTGIFPNLSILENFGLALHKYVANRFGILDRDAISRSFDKEVERLGIKTGPRDNKITTLSGGNQQKILIARAFALNPKVIVLNDPARGVDIGTKQDLYKQLRDFASNGGAVVYLSSEIEEFLGFANRVDVFFNQELFASYEEEDINEEKILSAMFGQKGHVEFGASTAQVAS